MNRSELNKARKFLGLKPVDMADVMGADYGTYKKWQNGTRNMTGTSDKCVKLLLAIKGTEIGKQFGV